MPTLTARSGGPFVHAETRPRLAHVPELDGLRGLAALMVLCHHLFFTSVAQPERWNWFVVVMSGLSHAGGYGVDLFFVLSGYLITSLLVIDRASPDYYRNFYWKRALRILPLYVMALLCLVLVMPGAWRYAGLSLVFLANFAPVFHVASAGPFWTLAIEEQFYLLWPQVVRRFSTKQIERLAWVIVVACPVLRLGAGMVHHYNYEFTFFHCDGLALGAMLACRQMQRKAMSAKWVWVVAIATTAAAFGFAGHVAGVFQLTGVSLIGYCCVAAAVGHTGAAMMAVLRSRVLRSAGMISYCLYVVNGYVVNGYDGLRGPMRAGDMQAYAVRAGVVVAVTLAVCVGSRYAIERPAMGLRRYVVR